MKQIIMIMLWLGFTVSCNAIIEYQPEDKLFIWAEAGLNMRAAPDATSAITTKIPFGKKVICKGRKSSFGYLQNSKIIKDNIETDSGKKVIINLKGNWVKVQFESYEGYVFDAYLSRFSPASKSEKFKNLPAYFLQECKVLTYLEKKDATLESGRDKIVLNNGIFMTQSYESNAYSFQMNIPDCSVEEVFLIIRQVDKYADVIIQEGNGNIWIGQDLGSYTIESFKNTVIISGEWAC